MQRQVEASAPRGGKIQIARLLANVCRNCGHHFRIGAERRLKLLFDDGAFARIRAGSLLTRRWSKPDSNSRSTCDGHRFDIA
jgi:acetyl-CoA carboxylase beta subunit